MNEKIYGVDYDSNGRVSSTGDILLVEGIDNAKQAIKNALLTPKGSYPSVDDEYGSEIWNLIGEDLTKNQIDALHVHIHNALLKQERVKEIRDIEIKTTKTGLKAILNVLLVNGSEEEMEINLGE